MWNVTIVDIIYHIVIMKKRMNVGYCNNYHLRICGCVSMIGLIFGTLAIQAHAQTSCAVTVQPGQSIQQAINASPGNQTICVQYGTYKETLDIAKDGLKVIGIPDPAGNLPVIDGEYIRPAGINAFEGKCPGTVEGKQCVAVGYGKLVRMGASNTSFENFEVMRSYGIGIGVHNNGNPISNITVTHNSVRDSRSTGIELLQQVSATTIAYNDVYRNANFAPFSRSPFSLDWPGGVASKGVNGVAFINNSIHENWGEGFIADANTGGSKTITVKGNHIYDNYALQIYMHAVRDVVIENNFLYHSPDPEFNRGAKPSQCIALTSSEPQYPAISTSNITMKNNVLAGCSVNYANWGGIMANLSFSNGTLYSPPGTSYINYSITAGSLATVTNATSSNNVSIGALGENVLGGDTNYPTLIGAGIQTTITLARGMSTKGFKLPNYAGQGANLDLIPDTFEVGPFAGTCTQKPRGDADCDNAIKLNDFEAWRKEYTGQLTSKTADFNASNNVDLADFETWRRAYTNSAI